MVEISLVIEETDKKEIEYNKRCIDSIKMRGGGAEIFRKPLCFVKLENILTPKGVSD